MTVYPNQAIPPLPTAANTFVPSRATATAPFVLGILAAVFGLIPIMCVVAVIMALIGLPLAVIAYRQRPRKRLARTAIILNVVGLGLSIAGFFIMAEVFNDVDDAFERITVTTTR